VIRLLAFAMVLLLVPSLAHAQVTPADTDTVLQALTTATAQWAGPLQTAATELLGGLAVITFVLSVGYSFLQGGDVVDMLAVALRQAIYFGFWQFVINSWPTFGHAIIASFQLAANQAGAIPSSPAAVVATGSDIAQRIMTMGSFWHPEQSAVLIIAAVAEAGALFFAAALMVVSLAKAYIVIGSGTLFLGFSGSPYTLDIAQNVFRMTIASGGRLFAIQLLAGLGATILNTWMGQTTALTPNGMWTIIGLSIIYAVVVFSIPASIEHMAGGTGHAHVGPGAMMRAIAGTVIAGRSLATAGSSMMAGLSGLGSAHYSTTGRGVSGALPPPGNTAGGAGSAASGAGTRMQPPGARYTP
jgi:type IV secretion system protein TrbL